MTKIKISKQIKKRLLIALWHFYSKKMSYLPKKINSNFGSMLKKEQVKLLERSKKVKENKKLIVKNPLILNQKKPKKSKKNLIRKNRKIKHFRKLNTKKAKRYRKAENFSKKSYKISLRKSQKIRRHKLYFKNRSKISLIRNKDLFSHKINILVKSNNVFCNLATFKDNKTINSCSAGKYNIQVSQKTIRYTYNTIITNFFKKIKKTFFKKEKKTLIEFKRERKKNKKAWRFRLIPKRNSGLVINIVASSRSRRKILKNISYNFKGLHLLVKVLEKKIYNGCRAAKKTRKKRRRMRILK